MCLLRVSRTQEITSHLRKNNLPCLEDKTPEAEGRGEAKYWLPVRKRLWRRPIRGCNVAVSSGCVRTQSIHLKKHESRAALYITMLKSHYGTVI
jgi:hypothetical protein